MFSRAVVVPAPVQKGPRTTPVVVEAEESREQKVANPFDPTGSHQELAHVLRPALATLKKKARAAARTSLLSSAYMGSNRWFPLPKRLRAELCYSDLGLSLNPGSGVLASYILSANGLYDPDLTGTGHQPKGWDQLITLYDHCVVEKAHIDVKFAPPDNNTIVGINVSGFGSTSYTNARDFLELPYCKWGMTGVVSTYGKYRSISLSNEVDIAKFLGVDDLTDGREFSSDNSANAVEDVTFILWAQSNTGGDPGAVYFVPRIKYTVLFMEPRDLAGS
jgi:hypothetical protein